MRSLLIFAVCLANLIFAQERKVVVYVSLDEEHARAVLEDFERASGIKVQPLFDTEDNKTVGMVGRIIAEQASPVADVYWNNECAQTLRLKGLGLLQPYKSPAAESIPAEFKDPEGCWTGFAARARVLIWNRNLISEAELPQRLEDFAAAKFRGKVAMAKPLTGTTLTHAGVLYATRGASETESLLKSFIANEVRFERGNAQVSRIVSEGVVPCGLTDTDDVSVQQRAGAPVGMKFLDQGDGESGTLVIPNSVMVLKGAPHLAEAKALVDAILSEATEARLARGASAQLPLHPGVTGPAGVPSDFKKLPADFAASSKMLDAHKLDLERMFGGAAPAAARTDGSSTILFMALGALALALVFLWLGFRRRSAAA